MTQNGVVTKLLDNNRAEVAVERGTACGGNCGGCEACVFDSRITISAENRISARPGDRVILESGTSAVLGAAVLVYMLPLLFLFGGYAAGAAFHLEQGKCVLFSLFGAAVGAGLVVLLGRKKKEISFFITGYSR